MTVEPTEDCEDFDIVVAPEVLITVCCKLPVYFYEGHFLITPEVVLTGLSVTSKENNHRVVLLLVVKDELPIVSAEVLTLVVFASLRVLVPTSVEVEI